MRTKRATGRGFVPRTRPGSAQPRTSFAARRIAYYRRIFSAYVTGRHSQLSFWWETPRVNDGVRYGELGPYYMTFTDKAAYPGPFDADGIPLLNYHGSIGLQYNPIAVSQYGLGNYNRYLATKDIECFGKFVRTADWLLARLETNPWGLETWNHDFDWDYREVLRAPWYSGLAQGQGISLLVRAFEETGVEAYRGGAQRAFRAFQAETDRGGVVYTDADGNVWFEEYIVSSPTHILNGFIWACWGVYDYYLLTGDQDARALFEGAVKTLIQNLHRYDLGFWSLYELSPSRIQMVASPFYHRLHVVQLEILSRLTGEKVFDEFAAAWVAYEKSSSCRLRALFLKILFKAVYY